MSYAAKVLADSIAFGVRLTTMEVQFPRFILAEVNTHRMFSRNSASSRAIPVSRRIEQVRRDPFVPESFGKNQPGMQASEEIAEQDKAREEWEAAAWFACQKAGGLNQLGAHKQHANRVIETYAWHTMVVSFTEYPNWRNLRKNPAAQPEAQRTAEVMDEAYLASTPRELKDGQWHLPYADEFAEVFVPGTDLVKVSVARCAAVSYERQDKQKTAEEYVALHDRLLMSGHMSCFEHQAMVVEPKPRGTKPRDANKAYVYDPPFGPRYIRVGPEERDLLGNLKAGEYVLDGYFCGNFRAPFLQYRKQLPGESVFAGGAA